ncbi:hypothetical protein IRB23M11_20700 [Alkalibacterium sp. m-11]
MTGNSFTQLSYLELKGKCSLKNYDLRLERILSNKKNRRVVDDLSVAQRFFLFRALIFGLDEWGG